MKHVRSVVLATLATFVVLACENSNLTSVVDPGDGLEQAAKPDCTADPSHPSCNDDGGDGGDPQALFDVAITGDVFGGPTEGQESTVQGQIVVSLFTLDIGAIADALASGATCFPSREATSVLALTQSSQDADVVEVSTYFKAKGDDGTTDVNYGLKMSGSLGGDPWLPANTSTIDLTTWEIGHDSGKGKKVACSGSGAFENVTTATVTAK